MQGLQGTDLVAESTMMNFNRGMGALPPQEHAWMVGRSVEEIDAVRAECQKTGKTPDEVLKSDDWRINLK